MGARGGVQTAKPRGQRLELVQGLRVVLPGYPWGRCGVRTGRHVLRHGAGGRGLPRPEPAQRRQGHRGRVQGPADASLPTGDPTTQRVFLGHTEQGKPADVANIVGQHRVDLRVGPAESPRGAQGVFWSDICVVGPVPRGRVQREWHVDLVERACAGRWTLWDTRVRRAARGCLASCACIADIGDTSCG